MLNLWKNASRKEPEPEKLTVASQKRPQQFTSTEKASTSKRARGENLGSPQEQFKKNGLRPYPRHYPDFWEDAENSSSDQLFPTVIYPTSKVHNLCPIVLLTRAPLPELPSFNLFFSGNSSPVSLLRGAPFSADVHQLDDLRRYTLRLHRIVGNKPFVCNEPDMPYFLAPLPPSWEEHDSSGHLHSSILWDSVKLAASKAFVRIEALSTPDILDFLHDAVVQDRWVEYTKRYMVKSVRQDLSPFSKPGEEERESEHASYLEYCKARVKDFAGLKNPDTPLIEVEAVPGILNLLDPSLQPQLPAKGAPKYLIPELCGKCTIPASVLRTAVAFPSILLKINELMLVKQLDHAFFSGKICEQLLRVALTPPAAGAEVNYERLEILGDAILKYTSSVHVFLLHPNDMEGGLHGRRGQIISNQALWQLARNADLAEYILSKSFSAKLWYPAQFNVLSSFNPIVNDDMKPDNGPKDNEGARQKRHKEMCGHQLGDKTLADTVEAIVAAAYLSGGHEAEVFVMKSLGIPVLDSLQRITLARKNLPPPPVSFGSPGSTLNLKRLEEIVGYPLKRPYYFHQILAKPSESGFDSTCFERLEFLGDGILDFFALKHIYEREPDLPPGALTLLKSAMVSNSTLAALCVRSGIYKLVEDRAYRLGNTLQRFAKEVSAKYEEEHLLAAKEKRPPGQYWLGIECPKVVSDIMEATLGALYISDGCSLTGAEKFFDQVFKPFYETHISFKSLSLHATNTVLDLFQKKRCNQYRLLKEPQGRKTRCRVIVHGVLLGEATESTATAATRRACEHSLAKLAGELKHLADTCECELQEKQVTEKTRA